MTALQLIGKIYLFGCIPFFWGCGKNVKYIQENDISDQVILKGRDCNTEDLRFVLEEISVLNTQQDTFVVRSHTPLSLVLQLQAINNGNQPKKILFNKGDVEKSNFRWIVDSSRTDTIHFHDTENKTGYVVRPNDSLEIHLQSIYFNFYKLLGDQKDYTESIKKLLTQFSLSYFHAGHETCVEQSSKTKIIVSNHKSHWEWW